MAGLCRPYAAFELVRALKQEIGSRIHSHARLLGPQRDHAAPKRARSGRRHRGRRRFVDERLYLAAQPQLDGRFAASHERDTGLDEEALSDCSRYWETVRTYYMPFDNAPSHGSADIYMHEIPGGQFTNLQQQANAMGLGHRWPEVEDVRRRQPAPG
ncbi:MAG: hypothetical protein R2748_00350 [Bryobacterales bacterium]